MWSRDQTVYSVPWGGGKLRQRNESSAHRVVLEWFWMKTALVMTNLAVGVTRHSDRGEPDLKNTEAARGRVSVAACARLQVCGCAHIAVTCNPLDLAFELMNMQSIRI